MTILRRSELLLPAGSLAKLKTAILYGADAVYAGTPDMSLRSQSSFSLEELVEGVRYAHERGKRIYLTLNLFTHNRDVDKLPAYIETVRKVKPDGLIIADPGVFQYVKDHAPELELHISTQANVCSWLTVDYWQKQGASLVVLAREASFEELSQIREQCPDIKLEAFVQGAMCMTYSGRCLLSNFMSERGANQGNCAHSCRWMYKLKIQLKNGSEQEITITDENADLFNFLLEEEFRPGDFMPIEEDMSGSYILNSRDLCLLPKLDEYLSMGIDSLKIEGRNKSEYYAAVTARAYRHAIDDYYDSPETWTAEPYLRELYSLQTRGFTLGFHDGRLSNLAHDYDQTQAVGAWQFAGVVREWQGDDMILEVRNSLTAGEILEFMPPSRLQGVRLRLYEFTDAKSGAVTDRIAPGQKRAIRIASSSFHNEDSKILKSLLEPQTVARRAAPLAPKQVAILEASVATQQAELGAIEVAELSAIKQSPDSIAARKLLRTATAKAPKLGIDGCCGEGCNGCVMFWHDAKFEKAREKMRHKKIGEML